MLVLFLYHTYLISDDCVGLDDEYKSKRLYCPSQYIHPYRTILLKHYPDGPELPVECYYFEPDPEDPDQITFYWKSKGDWKSILTPAVSLKSLKLNLEYYIEESVPIVLEKACKGPYETARLFYLAWKLADVSDARHISVAANICKETDHISLIEDAHRPCATENWMVHIGQGDLGSPRSQ